MVPYWRARGWNSWFPGGSAFTTIDFCGQIIFQTDCVSQVNQRLRDGLRSVLGGAQRLSEPPPTLTEAIL